MNIKCRLLFDTPCILIIQYVETPIQIVHYTHVLMHNDEVRKRVANSTLKQMAKDPCKLTMFPILM